MNVRGKAVNSPDKRELEKAIEKGKLKEKIYDEEHFEDLNELKRVNNK